MKNVLKNPVDNHQKPVVNLDEIEAARIAEENKAKGIIEKIEENPELDDNGNPIVKQPVVITPPKPPVDWEAKAKASQQEAMVLSEQLRKIEEEKNKKVEITDEYLKSKYPNWDDMTTGEQAALKKGETLEQEIQELKNNNNKFNNDRAWEEKVTTFINEELPDLFPKLVGREEDFKRFATRPTRKGLPLEDLAKIFLFENPVKEQKRSLFHAPNNGGKPPVNEGMDVDEAAELMKTRPLEYMRLVRAGKIKVKV
ncbi:MAG: hypothetical protein WA019_04035 [Candidatus Moraniibacteriota bacterium]